jgi:hypothetical protein
MLTPIIQTIGVFYRLLLCYNKYCKTILSFKNQLYKEYNTMADFEYYAKHTHETPHTPGIPPITHLNMYASEKVRMTSHIKKVIFLIDAMDEFEKDSYYARAERGLSNRTQDSIEKDGISKYSVEMVIADLIKHTRPKTHGMNNPSESMIRRWNIAMNELGMGITMYKQGNMPQSPQSESHFDKFFT